MPILGGRLLGGGWWLHLLLGWLGKFEAVVGLTHRLTCILDLADDHINTNSGLGALLAVVVRVGIQILTARLARLVHGLD